MKLEDEGQGKLIHEIIDVLAELAKASSDLEDETERLNAYAEELDEDLGSLEDYVLGDEDGDGCDGECDCCDEDYDEDDDFDPDDDDDDSVIEVECPNCGETICLPPSIDLAHLICPACNKEFSCIVDTDEDEDSEKDDKDAD